MPHITVKMSWARRDTGRYGGGPRRVLSAMGKRRTWPTWPTNGPLKKRQVGHRKAMNALAKRCFRHKIDKKPRKPFQGIRGGVTPVASRPSWSAQPTALDPPGPPLPSVGAPYCGHGCPTWLPPVVPPMSLPSLRSGAHSADALRRPSTRPPAAPTPCPHRTKKRGPAAAGPPTWRTW